MRRIRFYCFIYLFGHAKWLLGSQLPSQGLNIGSESQPPDHRGMPQESGLLSVISKRAVHCFQVCGSLGVDALGVSPPPQPAFKVGC